MSVPQCESAVSPPVKPAQPAEPDMAGLSHPLPRYFLATRPAFLSATLVAVLLGLAGGYSEGLALQWGAAALTLLFALVAHAGANVINDYYDALNGTDDANVERVFPFTGGSRFIQNGVLSLQQTAIFGAILLLSVIPAGLVLAMQAGSSLLLTGALGLFILWAYSAPPFRLASRGLGEVAVAAGWLLVILGTDQVQRGGWAFMPLASGLSYALLLANLLYINQFPDRRADATAGKRTLVVRLGARRARWGYLLLALAAHGWLLAGVVVGWLPEVALVAMFASPLLLHAAQGLWLHAEEPARLAPAIRLTILGLLLHGLLLAGALIFQRGIS